MKKLIPLFCALALLSGCAGPGEAAPSPEITSASPLPIQSPPPTVENWETAEPWWTDVNVEELPTRYGDADHVAGDIRYSVFQASEDLDLLLYAVTRNGQEGVQFLLRKGDVVGEAFRREGLFSAGLCGFYSGDYDGDGGVEYIISLTHSDSSNDLILCQWDENDGWTFLPYCSDEYNAQVTELLSFASTGSAAVLICGAASAAYPLRAEETHVSAMEDFSDIAILTPNGDAITAAFGVGAVINGTPKIFGILRATLSYDGEAFSLQDPQLEEMIGV